MAAIRTDFGSGNSHLNPGGSGGSPSLATVLRDIATDLAAVNGSAPASSIGAAIAAFTDPPASGEMATLRTRVNEIRAAVLELQGGRHVSLLTTAP